MVIGRVDRKVLISLLWCQSLAMARRGGTIQGVQVGSVALNIELVCLAGRVDKVAFQDRG